MQLCRSWPVVLVSVLGALMAHAPQVCAVQANSKPYQIKLRDGRKITVRMRGNDHFRWLEDKDRFPIVRTAAGYEYAVHDPASDKFVSSGFKVGDVDPLAVGLSPETSHRTTITKHRASGRLPFVARASENNEVTGLVNTLVILMRFRDHKDRVLPSAREIEIILNRPGGDPHLAPTGSYRDFVHENSYRQLDILSHVVGWVELPETEAYYAGGDSGLSGGKLDEALRAALDKIDSDSNLKIDFSEFDRDQDKMVGAVVFLHSGYAAEDTVGEDADLLRDHRIWSHKSGTNVWKSKSGHSVSNYFVASALFGGEGTEPCRIGVLLHESAHLGKLDDHYDNHSTFHRSAGVGAWCLTGEHRGFDGSQRYPPHLSAWCKIQLGWVKPKEIENSGEYRICAVERKPDVYKISRGFPEGEYLLIENRQPILFDSTIPEGIAGHGGLAIWHIDEKKEDNNEPGHPGHTGWPANGRHFKLALLQADGEYDLELPTDRDGNKGDGNDLFRRGFVDRLGPGDTGKFPNTDAYQDGIIRRTGIVISEISDSAEEMTFRVTFPNDGQPDNAETKPGRSRSGLLSPVPDDGFAEPHASRAAPGTTATSDRTTTAFRAVRASQPITIVGEGVVLEAPIQLESETHLLVRAGGSASSDGGAAFTTLLTGNRESGVRWPESSPWLSGKGSAKPSSWGTTVRRVLPAGNHKIKWSVASESGVIRFADDATLNVHRLPRVIESANRLAVADDAAPRGAIADHQLPVVLKLPEASRVEATYHGKLPADAANAHRDATGIACRAADGTLMGLTDRQITRFTSDSPILEDVEVTRRLALPAGEYTFYWTLQTPGTLSATAPSGEALSVVAWPIK